METIVRPAGEEAALADALERLRVGHLIAMPTETVYGLAGDATNGEAVARIFEAKGRPSFNPLIVHVCDRAMARRIADFGPLAERLADAFWPGPLTLVLPSAADSPVHPLARAGLATVAVRMPGGGSASRLIDALGRPLAAPSANPSGGVSATRAAHVAAGLAGRVSLVLDGGPSTLGLESTILKPTDDGVALLRPGALTAEEIETATGLRLIAADEGIEAPGQMRSHYAPAGRLRLDASHVEAGERLIAFGPIAPRDAQNAAAVFQLSAGADLREAAARLFEALSAFDDPAIERIAVAPIPKRGLGVAINDRLNRAAAPRRRLHREHSDID